MAIETAVARPGNDPHRAPPPGAVVDEASAAVADEALVTLTLLRAPMRLGDALAELHVTVSLLAELQARLPAVVAAARDQDHSWADIADQLGVSAAAARRRYRTPPTTTR